MRWVFITVALAGASCAALRTGWARVTWVDGKVAPAVSCSTRIGAEGYVEMVCAALNDVEANLLWKRERARVSQPEEI